MTVSSLGDGLFPAQQALRYESDQAFPTFTAIPARVPGFCRSANLKHAAYFAPAP